VLYSALSGNFCQFLTLLDTTLKFLYKSNTDFVICGYINVDYLSNSDWKQQSSLPLRTYNKLHVVNFPTRFWNSQGTAYNNIFVVNSRLNFSNVLPVTNCLSNILPVANGLSNHDAQFLILNTFFTRMKVMTYTQSNKHMTEDHCKLNSECPVTKAVSSEPTGSQPCSLL